MYYYYDDDITWFCCSSDWDGVEALRPCDVASVDIATYVDVHATNDPAAPSNTCPIGIRKKHRTFIIQA